MTSKGPKSKLDHESRAKRQKALEPPKEPQRPKTHWDHLIEEMVWLSKDFESERKFKLALAKKTAIRASKGMVDQATREERKAKEEELRMKKVALNISKDVKKFWTKIEKLASHFYAFNHHGFVVQYKHRLELDQKKKKALDKQLDFLLGQTERLDSDSYDKGGSFGPFTFKWADLGCFLFNRLDGSNKRIRVNFRFAPCGLVILTVLLQ
ncbi:putative DNA helicase chromatin remodeler HSA family [Helianthus anomalus]